MPDSPVIDRPDSVIASTASAAETTVSGCHAGADTMRDAASKAGKTEVLERYAKDYPAGPHDQPQSMCPAFGSLRVGLRMRRTATVLCGSACCVYGLTFTSHFYGARRTVGYVPFDSETLVTGKLFEDLREATYKLAEPENYDAIVLINLCVPTASGVPLDLLPKEINGVRIVGIDVPGFGVPTHAEAKDILAAAMLEYARGEAEQGPVARPAGEDSGRPTVALVGEIFPVDAIMIGRMLEPMGLAAGPIVPTREWRELYGALASPVAAMLHPFYKATARQFSAAGRQLVGSAPVGYDGTAAWLENIAAKTGVSAELAARPAMPCSRPYAARWQRRRLMRASPCRATRARSCWLQGCLLKPVPTYPMWAPPARVPSGPMMTAAGSSPRVYRSTTARRLKMTSRQSRSFRPISQSALRRLYSTPKRKAFPGSISPILFLRGRSWGLQDPALWPRSSIPQSATRNVLPAWNRSSTASAQATRRASGPRPPRGGFPDAGA
jgi:hypothetical protein